MINLKFDIKKNGIRYSLPIVRIKLNNTEIDCLIDTGAAVPVWCDGEETFKKYFPECEKQESVFLLGGFGNGYEVANAYLIPDFVLSDGIEEIHFKNMIFAVVKKDFSFRMILSNTMFGRMNLSIDTFSHDEEMKAINPNISITSIKDEYYVGMVLKNMDNYPEKEKIIKQISTDKVVDYIYLFSQMV